jgi:hypothetical protein
MGNLFLDYYIVRESKTLKMEAVCTSKTSETSLTSTWCIIDEKIQNFNKLQVSIKCVIIS